MVPVPDSVIGQGVQASRHKYAAAFWAAIWTRQLTPSFFCRLDDEVVYWNTSRLSG
jgi:hypothetical protein